MAKRKSRETFSPEDQSLLDVIGASYLSIDDVKWLKSKRWFKRFLKIYSKEIKKRCGKATLVDKKNEHGKEDIEVLDFTKTISIPSKEVIEILDFTRTIDITDTKDILNANYKAKRKVKIEKMLWSILVFICTIILVVLVTILINWLVENKKTTNMIKEIYKVADLKEIPITTNAIKEENEITTTTSLYEKYADINILEVNFENLKSINPDTVGWIKVNGTKINYPFVKTNDNEYYLKHTFDGSNNKKGWVFLDYRNDIDNLDRNTILYAHGLLNNQMFGSMRAVIKPSWYGNESNHIITIVTPKENLRWQVFSTYTIEPESYYITTNFANNEEFYEFIDLIKQRSVYDYNVETSLDDKILTLSSCYNDKKRMVLHAKLIK